MGARFGAAAVLLAIGGLVSMATAKAAGPGVLAEQPLATLTVEITGFHNDRGNAKVALWRSRNGFPADESKAERRYEIPITNGRAELTIEGLEPGPLAIAAFHDENDNGRIDRGFLGIPKEGLGVSRDAKGTFGPPSFDKARLNVGAGDSQVVRFRIFYYR